ncbi:hypothetical protein os4_07760 [Comamonadaceae bacterium OS-4]|nr:hypothetical protein os4_07760 [Comamonadaceae bacterium OS-4]
MAADFRMVKNPAVLVLIQQISKNERSLYIFLGVFDD